MGIRTIQNNKYYVRADNSSVIKVCDFIKQNTAKNSFIVVVGIDWSSEINYYSQRRGIALPNWSKEIRPLLYNKKDKIYGNLPIGALVVNTELDYQDEDFKNRFVSTYKPQEKETIGDWEVYYGF